MQRTSLPKATGALALALALALGPVACNQSDQDKAQQKADEAQRSGEQIGDSLGQLGEDARRRVQEAADQLRDSSRDVREAAARNGVSPVVAGEFRRHGVEVAGTPTCLATSEAVGQYHVECSGLTTDNKGYLLIGDDPGDPPSNFVGSVEGREIFRQECVGLC